MSWGLNPNPFEMLWDGWCEESRVCRGIDGKLFDPDRDAPSHVIVAQGEPMAGATVCSITGPFAWDTCRHIVDLHNEAVQQLRPRCDKSPVAEWLTARFREKGI